MFIAYREEMNNKILQFCSILVYYFMLLVDSLTSDLYCN